MRGPKFMSEGKAWYHYKDDIKEYFTPYASFIINWECAGDNASTTKIVDYLNNHKQLSYFREGLMNQKSSKADSPSVELPPGVYRYEEETYGPPPDRLELMDLREDSYETLGGIFNNVVKDVTKFLDNKKFYDTRGLMYKLGVLFYGLPGNGKTIFIRRIIKELLPKDAVVIFCPALPNAFFLEKINLSLKDRFKVFVFEELAAAIDDNNIEPFLNFLDGEESVNNSMVLSTTNYPEKLPANIIDRPSRFDKLYEIASPNTEEIKKLIKFFFDREAAEEEVKLIKGMSIAEIKEVSLLVQINDHPFEEAVKILKDRKKLCEKAFAKPAKVGFGFSDL